MTAATAVKVASGLDWRCILRYEIVICAEVASFKRMRLTVVTLPR